MALCDLVRMPLKYKFTLSGLTNKICSNCSGLNADHFPEWDGASGLYKLTIVGGACGITKWEILPEYNQASRSLLNYLRG